MYTPDTVFVSHPTNYAQCYQHSTRCLNTSTTQKKKRKGNPHPMKIKGESMRAYRLSWQQRNRVWVFKDGPLRGEPLFYGFDGVITKMLTKLGAVKYRHALNDGCHLLIGERPFPASFAMKVMFKENTGARYEHDELGTGWLECELLDACYDVLHVGVEVK